MGKSMKLNVIALFVTDVIFIILAYVLSFYIRFDSIVPEMYLNTFTENLPIIILAYIIPFLIMKMYRNMWSVAGIDEYLYALGACFVGFAINMIIMFSSTFRVPNLVTLLAAVLISIFTIGLRVSIRATRRVQLFRNTFSNEDKEKALIIGAGECAQLAISEIKKNRKLRYNVVGLLDDDNNKKGTYINGKKVLGGLELLKEIVVLKKIDIVILAINSLSLNEKKNIITLCHDLGIKVKIMPTINELIDAEDETKKIRDVDLRDLLGREEINLDRTGISEYITNKRIMVTGGGGSIGSELCRQIAKFDPKELIILDIYENNAYDLQNELFRKIPNLNLKVLIASVRDKNKMDKVFKTYKPDVVFHAAAHKHVPLMEYNPGEAIKNNVLGTLNIAQCADKYKTNKVVLISTDKAVNSTNVMGATKRLCEMVVQSINSYSETEFVAVRFGNVLGSNGSVIPLFKKQIEEGGPLTLTHKDITRYFMLIPEAAQLVLQAGAFARGGEIFVLDMGKPVKIYDLAVDLIRLSGLEPYKDIDIKVVGLRPGEKLYEELLMAENDLNKTAHKKIFIEKPADIDYYSLINRIDELKKVSEAEDKEKIKSKLQEIVPTYNRLDEVATTL